MGRGELRARAAGLDSGSEGRHVAGRLSGGERADGAGLPRARLRRAPRRIARRTWTIGFAIRGGTAPRTTFADDARKRSVQQTPETHQ